MSFTVAMSGIQKN